MRRSAIARLKSTICEPQYRHRRVDSLLKTIGQSRSVILAEMTGAKMRPLNMIVTRLISILLYNQKKGQRVKLEVGYPTRFVANFSGHFAHRLIFVLFLVTGPSFSLCS